MSNTRKINGNQLKKQALLQGMCFSKEFENKRISILIIDPPYNTEMLAEGYNEAEFYKHRANVVSANEKAKSFRSVGFTVDIHHFPYTTTHDQFSFAIRNIAETENQCGMIIQRPIPPHLTEAAMHIPESFDLDPVIANKYFAGPVTSEAIARVIIPFAEANDIIAVVGGKGFVGRGVIHYLEASGFKTPLVINKEDNLRNTLNANIVVAATGVEDLLNEEHISPRHKLVVSASYIPKLDGTIKTDIKKSAMCIPQAITPVPGGIGPLEMATLVERAAKLLGIYVILWSVSHEKPGFSFHQLDNPASFEYHQSNRTFPAKNQLFLPHKKPTSIPPTKSASSSLAAVKPRKFTSPLRNQFTLFRQTRGGGLVIPALIGIAAGTCYTKLRTPTTANHK